MQIINVGVLWIKNRFTQPPSSCLGGGGPVASLSEQKKVKSVYLFRKKEQFLKPLWYVCSLSFIWQGYPCELLALTVAGIPSMHICLDFIPELIAQPELEKQVLCSHLVRESL